MRCMVLKCRTPAIGYLELGGRGPAEERQIWICLEHAIDPPFLPRAPAIFPFVTRLKDPEP